MPSLLPRRDVLCGRRNVTGLRRFVPELALTLLAEGPIPDAGRSAEIEAAVLLVDISGFTTIVEQITTRFGDEGAELLQRLLNACFEPLVDTVERAGGHVLAFPGDAAICLWPAHRTRSLSDAVIKAGQCALQLRAQLDGLANVMSAPLRIRSAITSGAMQASLVGGVDGLWHVVVRGSAIDALGTAIKAAAPGEILLSSIAREACAASLTTAAHGEHWLLTGDAPVPVETGALPEPAASVDEGAIARLVPASVRARANAGQHGWLSEFRVVTVLFTVIKHVPVDHAEAQQAVHLIQAAIQRFDGELNQVVCDDKGLTAVAVFGLFQHSHENDCARAVGAAGELRDALQAVAVDARIGIATGRVFTGVRGGRSREEFAVMGSVVVLAARLAGIAEDVLCDSATQSGAASAFHFDPQAPRTLKGLSLVKGIWRAGGARTVTAESMTAGRQGNTLGRAAERARIDARLAALAESGAGGIIMISGEPGIGKSALVTAARESARDHAIDCVIGAGDPIQPLTTLRAWQSIVTALLIGAQPSRLELVAERLTSLLGPQEAEWFPLLNPVLPAHFPENDSTAPLTPESRARAARSLLVSLLRVFAAQRRLFVVIEDGHWIDSSSWDLIDDVVALVPELLLLVTTRPSHDSGERATALAAARGAEVIALAPMAATEIRSVVAARVGAADLADDLARWIQDRCEGNPLFGIEIALMLLEGGSATVRDGKCALVEGAAGGLESLPNTVRGVIAVRIDRLAAEEQLTLKVASVLGRQFDVESLRSIHPLSAPAGELLDTIRGVVTTGLLSPPSDGASSFAFSHALVQEVAYDLLTFAQRRSLHVGAAEYLEQHDLVRSVTLAPLLAHHWERAGVAAKAMVYLERSGEHALLFASANPEAEQFYTRLIRLADDPSSAGTQSDRVEAPDRVARARWERMLALAIVRQGRHTTARSHLERGLELVGRSMPSSGWIGRAEAVGRIVRRLVMPIRQPRRDDIAPDPADLEAARLYDGLIQSMYLGQSKSADGAGTSMLPSWIAVLRLGSLGERIGPSNELSCAYSLLANLFAVFHLHRSSLHYADLARAVAEQVDDKQALFRALTIGQLPAFTFGRWHDAERHLEEGQILGARLQNRNQALVSGCTLAFISFHRGRLTDAMTRFDAIHRGAEEAGQVLPQLWALGGMSEVLLREGRQEEALDMAERCLRLATERKATDQNCRFQAHGVIASVRARRNELDRAVAEVGPAFDAAASGANLSYSPQAGFCGVAEALFAARDAGGADVPAIDARLKRWLLQMRAVAFARPLLEPSSLYYRALWSQRHGRRATARRRFLKSIRVAERFGMPYELTLAQQALARLQSGHAGQ
jgi:class 3 adenylate cyclase/tetratricopeptide (TPR) repeat protein